MDEFKRLLDVLNEEMKEQDALLKLLAKERAAIVKLNQAEADALANEKQKLLDRAIASEKKRFKIICEIAPGSEKAPPKLSQIISGCKSPGIKKELSTRQKELKATTARVRELNSGNAELLNQALGVVASTLAIVRSSPGTETTTYSKKGSMKNEVGDAGLIRKRVVTTAA